MKKISYDIPEGCFASMEDRVRERISPERKHPAWGIVKPALLLVTMFVVIFGIGYGTMALTGTLRTPGKIASTTIADKPFEEMDEDEMVEFVNSILTAPEVESFLSDNL